jgi:predicted RNA polymerase sigma factor
MAEAVARRSHGKLVAYLAVHTRDVTQAEHGWGPPLAVNIP